jgi:hypothetical protein
MGLSRLFLADFVELERSGLLGSGRNVVEIGAQQLSDPFLCAADLLDIVYRPDGPWGASSRPILGAPKGDNRGLANSAPSSRQFWESLGFNYACIDFDGHRNSIALDLNHDAVPEPLRCNFDFVVNTGTTEHVANQENAFRVIHDLARVGAVMYHEVPVCMFGHGLINYSPKLFLQLFRQNLYEPLFIRTAALGTPAIPRYVRAMNRKWGRGHVFNFDGVKDILITAAFRKVHDRPFVTPLDLPRRLMMKLYARSWRTWKNMLPLR